MFVLTNKINHIEIIKGEEMKTKAVLAIVGILLLLVLLSSNLKVVRVERSYYCDEYRVSLNDSFYIPEFCLKSGK